jgi:hypothetical protein
MIKYYSENHEYKTEDNELWTSVTSLISKFKNSFDAETTAKKVSKKVGSKWHGMKYTKILDAWENEKNRSITLGNWYHKQREIDISDCNTIKNNYSKELIVYRPEYDNGIKLSGPQQLSSGLYPEFLVYLPSIKLCGQIDLIEVVNGYINIIDYKTCKEIKTKSIKDWKGNSQKMLHPLSNLDDVKFNHISLQLSLYMYMLMKHNPLLKRGKLTIQHVIFEEEENKDEYGFPLIKHDLNGPIIKEIKYIECPYLKYEIQSILNYDTSI